MKATKISSELREANRRAAWRWGSLVVSLLVLQVAGGIMAIILATGDESVAVVPNYHQKALEWDQQVALEAASRSLGWVCQVTQIDQTAGLRIRLADRNGKPIDLLGGRLQIYRRARAADVRMVPIPPGAFGLLELDGCFDHHGAWRITLDLRDRDGNQFQHSSELDVSTRPPQPVAHDEAR